MTINDAVDVPTVEHSCVPTGPFSVRDITEMAGRLRYYMMFGRNTRRRRNEEADFIEKICHV